MLGASVASAQDGAVEEGVTLPIVWKGVEFIDPAPQLAVMWRARNADEVPLTTISLARKGWSIPKINMDVSVGLDGGALIGQNNAGEDVAIDLTVAGGLMIGGIEKPLAWAAGKVPYVGEYIAKFIGLADGRAGYGGTYDLRLDCQSERGAEDPRGSRLHAWRVEMGSRLLGGGT